MKKIVFFVICVAGLLTFSSCGSTAPCGLSKVEKTTTIEQQDILVSEVTE